LAEERSARYLARRERFNVGLERQFRALHLSLTLSSDEERVFGRDLSSTLLMSV